MVDGEVKYGQETAMRIPSIPRIQVHINSDDRFLTLACLAGAQNHGDWSFFGEPALELVHE